MNEPPTECIPFLRYSFSEECFSGFELVIHELESIHDCFSFYKEQSLPKLLYLVCKVNCLTVDLLLDPQGTWICLIDIHLFSSWIKWILPMLSCFKKVMLTNSYCWPQIFILVLVGYTVVGPFIYYSSQFSTLNPAHLAWAHVPQPVMNGSLRYYFTHAE